MFLSNWLILKVIAAAIIEDVLFPTAGDLILNFDNNNGLFLTGGSVDYASNIYIYRDDEFYEIGNVIKNIYIKDTGTYKVAADICGFRYLTNSVNVNSITSAGTPPTLYFDGNNKLIFSNLDADANTILTFNSNTYDIGTASNIYIENSGTYEGTTKSTNVFAFLSNTVNSVTFAGSPPTLDFDGNNRLFLSNLDADANTLITFDSNNYDIGTASNIYIEDSGIYEGTTKSTNVFGFVSNTVNSVSFAGSPPTLDYDGNNIIFLSNIEDDATTILNTYDIGTASNIYIDSIGTYKGTTKSTNVFAFVSNTVTGTLTPSESVGGGGDIVSATGGTITTFSNVSGDYKVHTFTSSGTFTVTAGGEVEYLIVAGGGGGGTSGGGGGGGGGGAGGLLTGISTLTATSYSIVVGNGGARVSGGQLQGKKGSNSSFNGLTSIGGGGGGAGNTGTNSQQSGGSAGGIGCTGSAVNSVDGSPTVGQGNDGGNASPGSVASGGGGGGAGSVGGDGDNTDGGDGGSGVESLITGTSVYYAGGGAGARDSSTVVSPGGLGGGGDSFQDGTDGLGGGGGAGYASNKYGGAGGDGVVIIAYKTSGGGGVPLLEFDGNNKLTLSNLTNSNTLLTFNSNTYDIGTASTIFIENSGTYETFSKTDDVFAFLSNTVNSVNFAGSPPNLDFDGNNRLFLSNLDADANTLINFNSNTYDIGTASNIYIEESGSYEGTTKSASVFGFVSNTVNSVSFAGSPPTLDFDGNDRLSISNITPTSSTLIYNSNSYDIGTASSIIVKNAGNYNIITKNEDVFAFASNIVDSVTVTEGGSSNIYDTGDYNNYDGSLADGWLLNEWNLWPYKLLKSDRNSSLSIPTPANSSLPFEVDMMFHFYCMSPNSIGSSSNVSTGYFVFPTKNGVLFEYDMSNIELSCYNNNSRVTTNLESVYGTDNNEEIFQMRFNNLDSQNYYYLALHFNRTNSVGKIFSFYFTILKEVNDIRTEENICLLENIDLSSDTVLKYGWYNFDTNEGIPEFYLSIGGQTITEKPSFSLNSSWGDKFHDDVLGGAKVFVSQTNANTIAFELRHFGGGDTREVVGDNNTAEGRNNLKRVLLWDMTYFNYYDTFSSSNPSITFDSLNTISAINYESGSHITYLYNEKTIGCDDDLSVWTISLSGDYKAIVKGISSYVFTNTITSDSNKLYKYPPNGIINNITISTSSGVNSIFEVDGEEYRVNSSVASVSQSSPFGIFTNNVYSGNTTIDGVTLNTFFLTTSSVFDIVLTMPSSKTIKKYVIYPVDSTSVSPYTPGTGGGVSGDEITKRPLSWSLQGSNDSSIWTSLHSVSNSPPTSEGNVYTITSPGSYTFYKLAVTDNNGSVDGTQIGEWQLWGNDVYTSSPYYSLTTTAEVIGGEYLINFLFSNIAERVYITIEDYLNEQFVEDSTYSKTINVPNANSNTHNITIQDIDGNQATETVSVVFQESVEYQVIFHYGNFDSLYGYSTVGDAATDGIVYADTTAQTYDWGTLTSVTANSNDTTYEFTLSSGITADILLVAGGGGGGGRTGGGGGAGGLLLYESTSITSGTKTIVVGKGGSGGDGTATAAAFGLNGYSTSFTSLTTAVGGGGGSSYQLGNGKDGGSGGGGGRSSGTTSGGVATTNQGNDGGPGNTRCGGGGGATAAGTTGVSVPGDGGNGQNVSTTFGTTYGSSGVFAGGGGAGGGLGALSSTPGTGGTGGGGDGSSGVAGVNGQTHTGGGGGGGGFDGSNGTSGGNGGSGIVIIKWTS